VPREYEKCNYGKYREVNCTEIKKFLGMTKTTGIIPPADIKGY
jgi:hypothetical protein